MLLHQKKNHYLRIGLAITAVITAMALVGCFWTPYAPTAMSGSEKFAAPSLRHLFGTDNFGRDIFSRVMVGARTTFFISACTVTIGAVVGTLVGALTGYFGGLVDELKKQAMPGAHFFDDDALTDQPERVLAGEIIREKLLRLLDKEVPHGVAVSIEKMKERENGIIDIDATIFCERDTHKGIIIGKGGTMLKRVGTYARADMEQFFGGKINLKLWVKVKEDWRNREGLLRNFGYSQSDFD